MSNADAIRGAVLGPFVDWYVRAYGRHGLDRALSRLHPDDRRRFDLGSPSLGISNREWYPAPMIHRMLDGLLDGLNARERLALTSIGADETVSAALAGYIGIAFRAVASPRVCALAGPQLWHAFYTGGRVRIDAAAPRCHVMQVSGWPGHHRFLCEMNNAAGRAIYRAAGCDDASTEHAACVDRGGRACVYVIRW